MADNGHSDNDIKEIQHGMFIMPFHPPPKPLAQGFDEDLELAIRIEELGFKELWVGEHHTMKYETLASPEMFIARVLGETSTLRMGPAPVCLQLHHPAHVASRLSCLDHLSHGRLNVCFGPSSVSTDIELFGTDPKEGAAMTDEAAEMIGLVVAFQYINRMVNVFLVESALPVPARYGRVQAWLIDRSR